MSNDSPLYRLHDDCSQSPWLDTLGREYLRNGTLRSWIDRGIRGVTSNPTIFQKAITGSDLYDQELMRSLSAGQGVEGAYWDLVCTDIAEAADLFHSVYIDSHSRDGFVSVEVSPSLAYDTEATIAAAELLWHRLSRANVMIKIPATDQGIEAIRSVVAKGINVNVTLIFGLDSYARVLDAYMLGIEELIARAPDRVSAVAGVASFFISRVDTEIDQRLTAIGTPEALQLRGKAAIAQAKLAYQHFVLSMQSDRWKRLEANGAQPQRPLWASTSTKNPHYRDTIYVEDLIGPESVNTLPENTAAAFDDHGVVQRTVDIDVDRAQAEWSKIGQLGIDRNAVAALLERQGVDAFRDSFTDLLEELTAKSRRLS